MRGLLALALVAPALAGCLSSPVGVGPRTSESAPCAHPYPCAPDWPAALEGPFGLDRILKLRVPSHDSVELDGWIFLAALPPDVKAPVVLVSSPYIGNAAGLPTDAWFRENYLVDLFVEQGYAFAAFSVRGTGASGGCFESKGINEQKDQAFLVQWLASREWSNGRVGMMGLSYDGLTGLLAAIQGPTPLKTIVTGGLTTDTYTYHFTPQGAASTNAALYEPARRLLVNTRPDGIPNPFSAEHPDVNHTVDQVPVLKDRVCPALVQAFTEVGKAELTDARDAAYWELRRYISRFPNVTAAVLLTQGFQDRTVQWGEDAAWAPLAKAPKRFLLGQWGHEMPQVEDWHDQLLAWMEYWLKGRGQPQGLGVVEYQDSDARWHVSTAWPPAHARDETLAFSQGSLRPEGQAGTALFRAAPSGGDPARALCADPLTAGKSLAYASEPLGAPATVAGNPMAYLNVTSDEPGGVVAVHLYDLPSAGCEGASLLGYGAADLRFHAGNLQGKDFPVGTPTPVRVDILDFAAVVHEGHRIAVVLSSGGPLGPDDLQPGVLVPGFLQTNGRGGQPYFPAIAVHEGGHEGSHIVVPFVEGTLGGMPPTLDYPPRPFVPEVE